MSSSRSAPQPVFHTPGLARQVVLQQRAHFMRFHPTPSEALLWSQLRGRRLGVQFRRQVVVGSRIVDFMAPSAALVVEVDGDALHERRQAADAARETKLRRAGYRVLRLPASLVQSDLGRAVAMIRAEIEGARREG